MKKIFFAAFLAAVLLPIIGLAEDLEGQSYFASDFDKSKLFVQRVAIVPNRIPLTMTEQEKWREYNHEYLSKELRARGFEVVDYETTIRAFEESDLPLEDISGAEEKFAAFVEIVDCDAVIVPYIGLGWTAEMKLVEMMFLGITKEQYYAYLDLQLYSADTGTFVFAADKVGRRTKKILANPYNCIGCIMSFKDLGLTPNAAFKNALSRAAQVALEDFFAVFPAPSN